jgi:uncharacterized protein
MIFAGAVFTLHLFVLMIDFSENGFPLFGSRSNRKTAYSVMVQCGIFRLRCRHNPLYTAQPYGIAGCRTVGGCREGTDPLAKLYNTPLYALVVLITALTPHAVFAQQTPTLSFRPKSFIFPFPQTERYNLHVLGDGLAEGLTGGLQQAFEKDGTIKIIGSARSTMSLSRPDRNDWATEIDELIKTQPMNIAVIMVGLNDARNIRQPDGKVVRWNTDEWRAAYGKEVDKLIKVMKDRNIAVYWVGLPVMAEAQSNEAMGIINDVVREHAYIGGAKFIDTWSGFADQSGNFAAFGPDLTGQNQRLREADGITFTARGNRKLANYVEIILRRDLNEARTERNIPLAGDEEEQARLVPKSETKKEPENSKNPGVQWMPEIKQNGDQTPPPNENKTKVEPVQLQQPVLPAGRAADAPLGETIMGDLDEDVTSLATVSPVSDLNASIDSGERRLPQTERLYYKALVKGEAVKPKPGRADDFKWPRS